MSTDNIEALLSQITVTLTQDSTIVVKQRVTDIENKLKIIGNQVNYYALLKLFFKMISISHVVCCLFLCKYIRHNTITKKMVDRT